MHSSGYLPFDEAYHIYSSFFACDPDRQAFRDKLLDPFYGLNVYIITQPGITGKVFIVLKENTEMEAFLVELFSGMFEEEGYENDMKKGLHTLDRSTVQLLLKSMDTEFDKNVLRSVLALSHSRPELYDLGIDASSAKQRINKIIEVAKECENALIAGEDLVRIHLLEKQDKLQRAMVEASNTLEKKRNVWPEKRVEDLEDSIISIKEKLNDVESQLSSEDKSAKEKTRRAAKRRAESLLNESSIKRRKLGAGRPGEIDEDEERFLLKAIEDMSTAHGRRHDTVMYLHHRVKAKDMLKIVNYRRATKGKRPLKAVSILYLHVESQNVNIVFKLRDI
jgi:hypothetical protein